MSIWVLVIVEWLLLVLGVILSEIALNRRLGR